MLARLDRARRRPGGAAAAVRRAPRGARRRDVPAAAGPTTSPRARCWSRPTTEQVLLTLHAKAGRWFQLGGHCEPGDVLAGRRRRCARRPRSRGSSGLVLDPGAGAPRRAPGHLLRRAGAGAPPRRALRGARARGRRTRGQRGVDRRPLVAGRRPAASRITAGTGWSPGRWSGSGASRSPGRAAGRPSRRPTSRAGSPWRARPAGSGRPSPRTPRRGRARCRCASSWTST